MDCLSFGGLLCFFCFCFFGSFCCFLIRLGRCCFVSFGCYCWFFCFTGLSSFCFFVFFVFFFFFDLLFGLFYVFDIFFLFVCCFGFSTSKFKFYNGCWLFVFRCGFVICCVCFFCFWCRVCVGSVLCFCQFSIEFFIFRLAVCWFASCLGFVSCVWVFGLLFVVFLWLSYEFVFNMSVFMG